jgi:putative acetyltransferase
VPELVVAADDPQAADVQQLLAAHLDFAHRLSPPEDVHALDASGLTASDISFFSARDGDGRLLGVGALRELDPAHGEIKSTHTAAAARGAGVGRAVLDHLLSQSRARGYRRVSLETGPMDEFAPARALYRSVGFTPCPPFADYRSSPNSVCMTLVLDDGAGPVRKRGD